MKRWIWVLLLAAPVIAVLLYALDSGDARPAAQSARELAWRAYEALMADDVDAFEALGPTKSDLEYVFDRVQSRGTARDLEHARRELSDAGGFDGMRRRHRDALRKSFAETRRILATECHLPIASFQGLEPHNTTFEEHWGIEGGNVFFTVTAGTTQVSVKLAACTRVERGWICGKSVTVADVVSSARDPHSRCGGLHTRASLKALREIDSTIGGPDFPWLAAAIAPLVRIRDKIRKDPDQAVRLHMTDVQARVQAADVIVVSDRHDLQPCQRAFARILNEIGPMYRDQERNAIVGLEMIPDDKFEKARPLFSAPIVDDGAALLELMRSCTVWPVSGYVNIAESVHTAGATLIRVGMLESPKEGLPAADTPDAERRPGIVALDDPMEPEMEFFERNRRVADAVAKALKEDPRGIVILFYGSAHLLDHEPGFGNLHGLFLERGLEPLFLISFLRDWELAIRESKKQGDWSWWHEVAPGVLRTACVTDDEIVEMSRAEATK